MKVKTYKRRVRIGDFIYNFPKFTLDINNMIPFADVVRVYLNVEIKIRKYGNNIEGYSNIEFTTDMDIIVDSEDIFGIEDDVFDIFIIEKEKQLKRK